MQSKLPNVTLVILATLITVDALPVMAETGSPLSAFDTLGEYGALGAVIILLFAHLWRLHNLHKDLYNLHRQERAEWQANAEREHQEWLGHSKETSQKYENVTAGNTQALHQLTNSVNILAERLKHITPDQ